MSGRAFGWSWLGGALLSAACGHTVQDAPSESAPGGAPPAQPSGGASGSASAGKPSSSGGAGVAPVSFGGAANAGTTSIDLPGAGAPGLEPDLEPHGPVPCEDPQPLPHGGGFEQCKNGALHRTAPVACESALPRAEPASGAIYDECERDQDCVEGANGYCVVGACYYGCTKDDECGGVCFCGELVGSCQGAECRTDADCPADYLCIGNRIGTEQAEFRCQTPLDTCQSDVDCQKRGPLWHCSSDGTRRSCIYVG